MNFATVFVVEGIVVVAMLAAFFGFTTLIMDTAMDNTNNMITGMMTGDVNQIETSVRDTDSYMMSLGKTSTNFLDKIFAKAEPNADSEKKILIQKARLKLDEMKLEFADAKDIEELEEYLNQLEQ
jgi:hypothetical protein